MVFNEKYNGGQSVYSPPCLNRVIERTIDNVVLLNRYDRDHDDEMPCTFLEEKYENR